MRALLLFPLLLAGPAVLAQDGFGLDLRADDAAADPAPAEEDSADALGAEDAAAPEEPMGFGLDLSDVVDLRPPLAVLGVLRPPPHEGAQGRTERLFITRLSERLGEVGAADGRFARLVGPAEAAQSLGDRFPAAFACGDLECFEAIAVALGVERLVLAQLYGPLDAPAVRLIGLARGQEGLETAEVTAPGGLSAAFVRDIEEAQGLMQANLSAPLARLELTTNVEEADVQLGDRLLGRGAMEVAVPAGAFVLRVHAPDHALFEQLLSLEPGATLEVDASLAPTAVASAPATDAFDVADPLPARPSEPEIVSQPGFYLVLAGVALTGIGLGLGSNVSSITHRAIDANGDGVLDVTRAEMLTAHRNAGLANILLGVGGATLASGAVWLLLAPSSVAPGHGPTLGLSASGSF